MTTPHSPLPLVFDSIPIARNASVPFSLEVPERRTVAVLGDEDSGIGMLGDTPSVSNDLQTGHALVFGTEVAGLAEPERLAFRRRVGYLPAGDGLLQNLSLRDNVALPLRFGSGAAPRDIEGRVNVMLTALRLTGAAELRPAQANEENGAARRWPAPSRSIRRCSFWSSRSTA